MSTTPVTTKRRKKPAPHKKRVTPANGFVDEFPFRIGLEQAGTLMTPEVFDAIEEWVEDYDYELIHGVLIVSPPALQQERGPNEMLGYFLMDYKLHHPLGHHLDWTLPENCVRTAGNRRHADRAIWAGLGRVPDPKLDLPTIAVEFVSAGKRNRLRDYVEKRAEYLASGIFEYWLFDRFRRTLTVYRLSPAEPAEQVVAEDEIYRTPLLPGFELPVARILAVADMFEQAEKTSQKEATGRRGKRKN